MTRGDLPWRMSGPAAASLLVNALLIAAMLNLGMGRRENVATSASLTVLSLAVVQGAEDGSDRPDATPPLPVEAVAPMIPVLVTQPVVQPVILPVFSPSPVQAAAIIPETAPSTANVPAPAPPASAPAPAAIRRGSADGLDVNAPPGTSRSYAAKIRSWLYAHKIYPRRARMRREEGLVRVRFVIDRAGLLVEGMIVDGSGVGSLDEEAMAMMRRASPYPMAPADLPGERIEFVVPIEFALPA